LNAFSKTTKNLLLWLLPWPSKFVGLYRKLLSEEIFYEIIRTSFPIRADFFCLGLGLG